MGTPRNAREAVVAKALRTVRPHTASRAAKRAAAAAPAARKRLSPAEREKQIVAAAIDFFAEVGFGGQTRELSRRLGITQPLLYRYFPSKQDLIERVYREVYLGRWDARWETLLADRAQPLRARLIEFYRQYTGVIFSPQWIRLYLHSGLLGIGFNRRYIARLEQRLLRPICAELRATAGFAAVEKPISDEEIELVWNFHAGIFYYGVRKFVYRMPVRLALDRMIEVAVDTMLHGLPDVLARRLAAEDTAAARAARSAP